MRVMSKFVFIMLSFYTCGVFLFVYLFVVVEGGFFFWGGGVPYV